jgi:putative transposase
LQQAGWVKQVPPQVWRQAWVVHCQPVGSGQAALKYLAPYIFRVALSNNRILKLHEGQVTFRYRDSTTRHWKSCTLPAEEFIRRFLQHVLPKGFQKVRYYGLFSPGQRLRLVQARQVLGQSLSPAPTENGSDLAPPSSPPSPTVILCPTCGRPMRHSQTLPRSQPACRSP